MSVTSLQPDLPVATSFDDYRRGRDPLLDTVRKQHCSAAAEGRAGFGWPGRLESDAGRPAANVRRSGAGRMFAPHAPAYAEAARRAGDRVNAVVLDKAGHERACSWAWRADFPRNRLFTKRTQRPQRRHFIEITGVEPHLNAKNGVPKR